MSLGWRTGLTAEVAGPFMQSGTLHLFAISGLHVALVVGILVVLLRVLRLSRQGAALVAIPLLWFYTGATGWQLSAVRATVMMTVLLGGWLFRRPVNVLNSLGLAALDSRAEPMDRGGLGRIVRSLAGFTAVGGASFSFVQSRGIAGKCAGGLLWYGRVGELFGEFVVWGLAGAGFGVLQLCSLVFHARDDDAQSGSGRVTWGVAICSGTGIVDDGRLVLPVVRGRLRVVVEINRAAMGIGEGDRIHRDVGIRLVRGSANGADDFSSEWPGHACGIRGHVG